MSDKTKLEKQKRLREIEDRKIEILMEISSIKDNNLKNNENAVKLNSEYSQLHKEHYQLQMKVIKKNRS